MKIFHYLLAALLLATGLAGCSEATDVTFYEAGVYQGTPDPLLQTNSVARAETLLQRFKLIQTDR